jgi:hypothetical protein
MTCCTVCYSFKEHFPTRSLLLQNGVHCTTGLKKNFTCARTWHFHASSCTMIPFFAVVVGSTRAPAHFQQRTRPLLIVFYLLPFAFSFLIATLHLVPDDRWLRGGWWLVACENPRPLPCVALWLVVAGDQ